MHRRLKKLGPQHHAFILNLVARPSQPSAAYRAAGFAARTPGAARQGAYMLQRDPLVAAEIKRLIEEKHKALHMDVDEILARAAMLARTSASALYDEDGKLRPIHELEEEHAVMIAGLEVEEITRTTGKGDEKKTEVIGAVKKVRLRDPMAAIRLLAEHKKLVKNADEGVNALASAIADRMKLARERRKAKDSK